MYLFKGRIKVNKAGVYILGLRFCKPWLINKIWYKLPKLSFSLWKAATFGRYALLWSRIGCPLSLSTTLDYETFYIRKLD